MLNTEQVSSYFTKENEWSQFCLQNGNFLQAEYYLKTWNNRVNNLDAGYIYESKPVMLLAALYIQRDNFQLAIKFLKATLESDWKSTTANLLMGIIYDKLDRPGLSRKHFAIVKCKKLRELNLLPPKSTQPKNFRTVQMEYKVEIVDFKNIMSKD